MIGKKMLVDEVMAILVENEKKQKNINVCSMVENKGKKMKWRHDWMVMVLVGCFESWAG